MEDLPNPFRKPVRPVAPPPAGQASEWTRIYIMAVVLFLVVATMIFMQRAIKAPPVEVKAPPREGEIDYTVGASGDSKAPPANGEGVQDEPPPEIQVPPAPPEGEVSFRALAAPFKDGTEKLRKETPEFVTLINVFLNSVTRESMAAAVQPDLTAEKAYTEPDLHRGAVLRCHGRIIELYTEKLRATNPDGVKYVYLGIMQEDQTGRTIYFYTPELPTDPETGEPIKWTEVKINRHKFLDDWVEIEVYYLRLAVVPASIFLKSRGDQVGSLREKVSGLPVDTVGPVSPGVLFSIPKGDEHASTASAPRARFRLPRWIVVRRPASLSSRRTPSSRRGRPCPLPRTYPPGRSPAPARSPDRPFETIPSSGSISLR